MRTDYLEDSKQQNMPIFIATDTHGPARLALLAWRAWLTLTFCQATCLAKNNHPALREIINFEIVDELNYPEVFYTKGFRLVIIAKRLGFLSPQVAEIKG